MLSNVLNSERAIQVNIQIMRIYSKLNKVAGQHRDLILKLKDFEKQVAGHDDDFKIVFKYLKELLNPKTEPLRKIGFRQKGK